MDITSAFGLILGLIRDIINLLYTKIVFTAYGVSVSILHVIGAMLILSMVIAIFWRGVRA